MKGSANEQWTNFQSDMKKIRDTASKNPRRKSKSRHRQKLRTGSIFKTNEKIAHLQEGKNPVTVFQTVDSL